MLILLMKPGSVNKTCKKYQFFYCTYAHSNVSDVCCIFLVLMFSVHVVFTAHLSILGRVIPHLWLSFRVLHCSKKDFKFFLTKFEGLRTEGLTTVQLVKPILGSKLNEHTLIVHVTFVHHPLNGIVYFIYR